MLLHISKEKTSFFSSSQVHYMYFVHFCTLTSLRGATILQQMEFCGLDKSALSLFFFCKFHICFLLIYWCLLQHIQPTTYELWLIFLRPSIINRLFYCAVWTEVLQFSLHALLLGFDCWKRYADIFCDWFAGTLYLKVQIGSPFFRLWGSKKMNFFSTTLQL